MRHFTGTASSYAEFRSGYPSELWDSLVAAAVGGRSGRALDLGCGPGTATIELAKRFESVVAVDLDREMVEEGRRQAEIAGCANIEWINAAAEDVDYPSGSFELIVIASAFHWMDRPLVASKCRSMLTDDGCLALLGNPTPLMQVRTGTALGTAIGEVQQRWFGDDYHVLDADEHERPEVILERCGFSEVTVSHVPYIQEWTVERF